MCGNHAVAASVATPALVAIPATAYRTTAIPTAACFPAAIPATACRTAANSSSLAATSFPSCADE